MIKEMRKSCAGLDLGSVPERCPAAAGARAIAREGGVRRTPAILAVGLLLAAVASGQAGYFGNPSAPVGGSACIGSMVVADFDGDSLLDVATCTTTPNVWTLDLLLLRGDGLGNLSVATYAWNLGGGHLDVLDFDHNGSPDLLADNGIDLRVVTNAAGTFSAGPVIGPGLSVAAIADLDLDGWPEPVCRQSAAGGPSTLSVFRSVAGGLVAAQSLPALPGAIWLEDLDGDGRRDLVSLQTDAPAAGMVATTVVVHVRRGLAGGTFGALASSAWAIPPSAIRGVAAADLDGDGRADLVLLSAAGPAWSLVRFAGSAGPAAVQAPTVQALGIPVPWAAPVAAPLLVDVDLDGFRDLVVGFGSASSAIPAGVSVFLGDGSSFAAPMTTATGANLSAVLAGDLERDGDPDLVIGAFGISTLTNRARFTAGCAGVAGIPLARTGSARIGNAGFSVGVSQAAANAAAVLGLSTAAARNRPNLCLLGIEPTQMLPVGAGGSGFVPAMTDALGNASVPLPLPAAPSLHGLAVYAQWGIVDPAGTFSAGGLSLALSRAMTIILW